jgi:hypothetical protein
MGMTLSPTRLAHIIPVDNAYKENSQFGIYHFRLWKLGSWYDVVVDDTLPVTLQSQMIFARNQTFLNEFWSPLLEKAFAK